MWEGAAGGAQAGPVLASWLGESSRAAQQDSAPLESRAWLAEGAEETSLPLPPERGFRCALVL